VRGRYWSSLDSHRSCGLTCDERSWGMDINTRAFHVVMQSIGEEPKKKFQPATAQRGLKRAAVLSPERRRAIAQKASRARWKFALPDPPA
jgi:hypothetical protein